MYTSYLLEAALNYILFLPVLLLIQLLIYITNRRSGLHISPLHIAGTFLFAFVLICMLTATGALDVLQLRYYLLNPFYDNYHRLNLVPLQRGYEDLSQDNVLNFYLFIPFGFLLPMLWDSYKNMFKVICTGFIFSMAIEISQWFNIRATDIDDVIMNTLGTAAGYLIYMILLRWILPRFWNECRLTLKSHERNILLRHEGVIYIFAAWLFNFFLKPVIKFYLFR